MRRAQTDLEPRQVDHLARRARTRGTTTSHLIREAIDSYLATPEGADDRLARFRTVVEATFGAAPDVPTGRQRRDTAHRSLVQRPAVTG